MQRATTTTFDDTSKKAVDPMFQRHDYFNMIILSYFSLLDLYYLYHTTDFTKLYTTKELQIENAYIFNIIWNSFITYIFIDSIWIALCPQIAASGAKTVLIHHVVTFFYAFLPKINPNFMWHFGVALTTEMSTTVITMRRNVPIGSFLHQFIEMLVICTWFPIRCIIFPALCVFIINEYLAYSVEVKTYYNVFALATIAQFYLTYLGVSWSIDLLKRLRKGSSDKKEERKTN